MKPLSQTPLTDQFLGANDWSLEDSPMYQELKENILTPTQNIAVDLIIANYYDKQVYLYAPKRTEQFNHGRPALPGVLLKVGESAPEAIRRIIETKTPFGLDQCQLEHYQELPANTDPGRDPRGHVIAIPILIMAQVQAPDLTDWVPFLPDTPLAFDHTLMVNKAYSLIKQNVKNRPLPFLLLQNPSPLADAKQVIAWFEPHYDKFTVSNFKARFPIQDFLKESTTEKGHNPMGKPAKVYYILKDKIKKSPLDGFL